PPAEGTGAGRLGAPDTATASAETTPSATHSAAASAAPDPGDASGSAPAGAGQAGGEPSRAAQGLLGGTGLLGGLGSGGQASGDAAGQRDETSAPLARPHVTIPPLVDDLLPALGLGADHTSS